MATLWFSKPVACCLGIDRTCSILKNNRSYRMDFVYPNVCYASSNIYGIGSEVYRISTECICWSGYILSRWFAVDRSDPVDGTWCISSI